MIDTEQIVLIDCPIEGVWDYVRDIERWANLMPGLQSCEVIDANDSRWTLKVGVSGLVRTVRVGVHVDAWDGPEQVTFTYKLENDPVEGGGSYLAARHGAGQTEVTLKVRVEGAGPMAPMWEAMGKPLLPQFAKAFAGQLKAEIENTTAAAPTVSPPAPHPSFGATLKQWLLGLWRAVPGSEARRTTRP